MPIKVTIDGRSWVTDDLTLAEAEAIERASGVTWMEINPLVTAGHAIEIMTAFLARDGDRAAAEAKVRGMSVKDAIAAFELVPDDMPEVYEDGIPNPAGEASTT